MINNNIVDNWLTCFHILTSDVEHMIDVLFWFGFSGENGNELVFIGPGCPGFFQTYPDCVSHKSCEIRGGEEEVM